jgi:hypothetical protein
MRALVTARNIGFVLSGIMIGLMLSGGAHAIVNGAFRYSTPQTGYLTIPAASFVPASNSTVYSNDGSSIVSTGPQCFRAAVNLPQDAKITQLAMWYSKNDDDPAQLSLDRVTPAEFNTTGIAGLSLVNTGGAGKSAAVNITNTSLQTVNNIRYMYIVNNCISDQEFFAGARIKYTYTTAGD